MRIFLFTLFRIDINIKEMYILYIQLKCILYTFVEKSKKSKTMQKERNKHRIKILIIDLISECEKRIRQETNFMNRNKSYGLGELNSRANIARSEKLKQYLLTRYNN